MNVEALIADAARVPSDSDATLPHATPARTLATAFHTDLDSGLTVEEATDGLGRFGPNELAAAPATPTWRRLAAQFRELLVWILIAAALISGVLGDWVDALAILAIVLLNGVLGFIQEERSERALASLQDLSAPMAKAFRGGLLTTLPARDLVPGDVVQLESGDNVPADVRLVRAFGLSAQEAALTGESTSVSKDADAVLSAATALGDRRNMAYMGTVIAAGKATALVTATGMKTELGRIAGLLSRYEREPTPLQRRLAELGRVLIFICLTLVALIFALQMVRGGELLEVFMLSVSLAVAAVPEGLPAVVTIVLALSLQRMVKRNALIRRLPSVETLGSVTVICSDKTGTLTRNEMTVREIVVGGVRYRVTGSGYAPRGDLVLQDGRRRISEPPHDLAQALTIGARCNNARLVPGGNGSASWRIIGDPTEGALLVAARKAGVGSEDGRVLYEIPFDSERKAMSVVAESADGTRWMYTKGAPEVILEKCSSELGGGTAVPLDRRRRAEITATNTEMASRALRVLALAFRRVDGAEKAPFHEDDLVFAGLAGMIDPPRDEVREAVDKCHRAGIRPVMITGDHSDTALAIARDLGIADAADTAVSGQRLDAMSDSELLEQVEQISVYARVSAEHKMRVVRAWKDRDQVVAMTGDGVNDAPAVKAADIGIAMGVTGTHVTKEASDMVLTDDNFTSIVNAVEEGRGIFANVQKFVHYLLSCNAGEVLLMLLAAIAGWPAPLKAIHLLWINLVTDGLPALALGMEPPERDIMNHKPRPLREPVITWSRGASMLGHGLLMAASVAVGFWLVYQGESGNLPHARTVAFSIAAFSQLLFALSCRSLRYTMPQLGPFTNPYLLAAILASGLLQLSVITLPFTQSTFGTATELGWEWLLIAGLSLTPVSAIEIVKIVKKRSQKTVRGTV